MIRDLVRRCIAIHRGQTGVPCFGWEGPCDSYNATLRRQNTSYCDDKMNWVQLCPDCMKINDEYWEEMWRDYYSGCL